jgi:hypothetical protein
LYHLLPCLGTITAVGTIMRMAAATQAIAMPATAPGSIAGVMPWTKLVDDEDCDTDPEMASDVLDDDEVCITDPEMTDPETTDPGKDPFQMAMDLKDGVVGVTCDKSAPGALLVQSGPPEPPRGRGTTNVDPLGVWAAETPAWFPAQLGNRVHDTVDEDAADDSAPE